MVVAELGPSAVPSINVHNRLRVYACRATRTVRGPYRAAYLGRNEPSPCGCPLAVLLGTLVAER